MRAQILGVTHLTSASDSKRTIEEKRSMRSLHSRLIGACLLGVCLMFAPAAYAEPLTATGFYLGSAQTISLTDPARNGNVSAGALSLTPPAAAIDYCLDLAATISFRPPYAAPPDATLAAG